MRLANPALLIGLLLAAAAPALAHPGPAPSVRAQVRRVETNFAPITLVDGQPPVRLDLKALMRLSNVPGLSIAVIDHDRIVWAKGYGVTQAGGHIPVTPHTLFAAASVSKPVTSIATLSLVQDGRLTLDDDVDRFLTSWRVPDSPFTQTEKVTLRRIMTHTAGTSVHGYFGYAPGEPLPTTIQILNGEPPANSRPVVVEAIPGSQERYSGGGVMIEQQLLTDVTGEPFPRLMQERVLGPLGLRDSTFANPLPRAWAARAASGHQWDGEVWPGRWNVYPEMAVGGLWTTPSDLARIAIEINLSADGRSNRILSAPMAKAMVTPQLSPEVAAAGGPAWNLGLGWFLGGGADEPWFGHEGVNPGFLAQVYMMRSGRGVVVMANNWSSAASALTRYVASNVAAAYGWRFAISPYTPWPYADTIVLATARLHGAKAAIARYRQLAALSGQRDAAGRLKAVWQSNPPDYKVNEWDLLSVAQTLADPRHLNDAIALMQVEVADYPDFTTGYAMLADLYAEAGKDELALQALAEVLKRDPANEGAIEERDALLRRKLH